MNENIEVKAVSETLSDGSKVWDVRLTGEDGNFLDVNCVSEAAAYRMVNRLNDLLAEGGAA